MGREGTTKPANPSSNLHEPRDHLVLAGDRARHGRRVDLLELELDPLERIEVALEDPLKQIGEKLEAVQLSGVTRARRAFAIRVHHIERALADSDDPPLGDEAVDTP